MKKLKHLIVLFVIAISSFLSFGFADNYFEFSKNLDIFSTLFKELNTYYVDETEPGELMKTAIDEMLQSLDPYTNYIPESQIEDYKFMTTGQYGGIGALIHQKDGATFISEPYENFPAFNVGLVAGDQIIEIDGDLVKDKNTSAISDKLKGSAGTSFKLKIKEIATGKEVVKEITREKIKVKDVPYYGMLNEQTGYIKLVGFTPTASKEFIGAFKELRDSKGMKNLVVDLRGNGGGLLIQAVDIVNTFIPKGAKVVETKGKLSKWNETFTTRNEAVDTEIPVVVLVNESSASASEIVTGVLQDYDRAVIIGKQTFGKGLVQETRPLSYNSQLKVTVAKYYIPSGRCIQRIDYTHKRNDGKALDVPDSLIKTFETLVNKRQVKDGKGIKPDIVTERDRMSPIAYALASEHHIFDFATKFKLKNPTIATADKFEINSELYNEFVSFVKDKEYSYTSKSEELLEKLKKEATIEKYFSDAEEEYELLKNKLKADKNKDLEKFNADIKLLLKNEIVSRYYYQNGRIECTLADDPDILKAKEILGNKTQYYSILNPNSTK